MARFFLALCILIPAVLAENTEKQQEHEVRALPVGGGIAESGALGANFGQQSATSETHDKKNFGLNFSSDKGSSNQYSNTDLQAAAAGGFAQAPPVQYPVYQYQYPYPYYSPAYPYAPYQQQFYPNVGNIGVPNYGAGPVQVGVPNLGVGSSVQLPNVAASSGGVVQGQVPNVRY